MKIMKHIQLILHKLSGSRDNYGTITYEMDIPDHFTYIDLALHILSEKYLEQEGFANYLEKDDNFMYDFFEDFQDNAVIKNLDDLVPNNKRIIFSPNYYNYPKDPCITLNYVFIRKDMKNIRWKKYMQKIKTTGISDLTKEISMLMNESDFMDDVTDIELGSPCWSFMNWKFGRK